MRWIVLSWLAACEGDVRLAGGAPPPDLEVSPVVAGRSVVVEAWGWPTAGTAYLMVGARAGRGPCTPGGACLGVRAPVRLATGHADARGHLRLEGRAPATLPAALALQVAQLDPAAPGGVSLLSTVVTVSTREDPLAWASDAFDGPLVDWDLLSDLEGTPPLHDRVDVAGGALVIDPNSYDDPALGDGGEGPAWFQDRKGPLALREVAGDFAARVHLRVGRRDDLSLPPVGSFEAAGFVLRDPASTAPIGDERWLMYNLGWQAGAMAFELKTTFPDGPDPDAESQSTLMLDPVPTQAATLLVCRVGDRFRFWRRLDGEAGWTEQTPDPARVWYDGADLLGGDLAVDGFVRPDLPDTLQLGLMVGAWSSGGGPPVRGAFDELWVGTPRDEDDCTSAPVAP